MKGFTITPVLFAALLLIVGLMMLTFSDMDRRMAEGIGKESRLNKLSADKIENMSAVGNLLFFHACRGAADSSAASEIEDFIENKMGGDAEITECDSGSFTVEYSSTFYKKNLDAEMNNSYTVSRTIDCYQIEYITLEKAVFDCGSVWVNCTS